MPTTSRSDANGIMARMRAAAALVGLVALISVAGMAQAQNHNARAPAKPAYETSFDCTKAALPDERAICTSAALSAMDRQLAGYYADIRGCTGMGGRPVFEGQQRQWIVSRSRCRADTACLAGRYQARIDALAGDAARARAVAQRQECPGF